MCVIVGVERATPIRQLMSGLPLFKWSGLPLKKPFFNSGVNYLGPLNFLCFSHPQYFTTYHFLYLLIFSLGLEVPATPKYATRGMQPATPKFFGEKVSSVRLKTFFKNFPSYARCILYRFCYKENSLLLNTYD